MRARPRHRAARQRMRDDAGNDQHSAERAAGGHLFAEHECADRDDGDELGIGQDREACRAEFRHAVGEQCHRQRARAERDQHDQQPADCMRRHVEAEKQRHRAERDRHAEKQAAGADQRRIVPQQSRIDREIERINERRRDRPEKAAQIDLAAAQPGQCDKRGAPEDHRDADDRDGADQLLQDQPVEREGRRRIGVKQQDRDAGLQGLQAFPKAQGLRRAESHAQQNDAPAAATQHAAQIDLHKERRDRERDDCEIVAPEQHRRRAEPVGIEPPRQ